MGRLGWFRWLGRLGWFHDTQPRANECCHPRRRIVVMVWTLVVHITAKTPPGGQMAQGDPAVPPWLLGSPVQAARGLLGWRLVVGSGESSRLIEVEAYAGSDDPASHAYRGQTRRNAAMFGAPGTLYVYLIYGLHNCANVVCGPAGTGSAVLLRAAESKDGAVSGPGLLGRALQVSTDSNGMDLFDPLSPLRLDPPQDPVIDIESGPRVGISRATQRTWRFWERGNPAVTPYRRT